MTTTSSSFEMTTDEKNAQGSDKVTRYNWKMEDCRGEFHWIAKKLLHVNTEVYQRDATIPKVLNLASNWSWISCGSLTIAVRDSKYWVVDGQHRKLAADKRSDITELPCLVFPTSGVKEEAKAFLATNRNRKAMSAIAAFRADLVAGSEIATCIKKIIDEAGLRLTSSAHYACDFKAIGVAKLLAEANLAAFRTTMLLCGELAINSNSPVSERLVQGLFYIDRNFADGGLHNSRLRSRIVQVGTAALYEGAVKASQYYARGGAKVFADGMMQVLNKGLRNRFVLDNREEGFE